MSGAGLGEVLAAHDRCWSDSSGTRCEGCGAAEPALTVHIDDWATLALAWHATHLEAAALDWVRERLAGADVLEAVCEAIALVSGEVDQGESEAAVSAVAEALGVGEVRG